MISPDNPDMRLIGPDAAGGYWLLWDNGEQFGSISLLVTNQTEADELDRQIAAIGRSS